VLNRSDVRAELAELCRGEKEGRRGATEITLFKSVGTALEDLAAAQMVHGALGR
jgi:alanine dehydrogenase